MKAQTLDHSKTVIKRNPGQRPRPVSMNTNTFDLMNKNLVATIMPRETDYEGWDEDTQTWDKP